MSCGDSVNPCPIKRTEVRAAYPDLEDGEDDLAHWPANVSLIRWNGECSGVLTRVPTTELTAQIRPQKKPLKKPPTPAVLAPMTMSLVTSSGSHERLREKVAGVQDEDEQSDKPAEIIEQLRCRLRSLGRVSEK